MGETRSPTTCDHVIFQCKENFADGIKLSIQRWEILDYQDEPHVITEVLTRGGGKQSVVGDVMMAVRD